MLYAFHTVKFYMYLIAIGNFKKNRDLKIHICTLFCLVANIAGTSNQELEYNRIHILYINVSY